MESEASNCSFTTHVPSGLTFKTFSLISYIPLFIFGIICNVLALWIFCCKKKEWTVTTLFMRNLMIADILAVLTFPFRLYVFLHKWDLGTKLCKDVSVSCCIFWIICITICILRNLEDIDYEFTTCFQKDSSRPFFLSPVFEIVGFLLPLLTISFCSGKVIMTLRVRTRMDTYKQCSVEKAVKLVIANLVSFIICFLPIHIGYTIRFVAESLRISCNILENINEFIHVANFIANLNCVLDSVIYYFAASEFQDILSKQFTLSKCRSSCVP
ncbi:hypothetical protein GDO78_017630 [Eleutherodactylus coqui]|uniref:G-protein coupled receptors family 1 profile domain-containing protein n=1 Tax=Eleutherodactylus coqui TaxID=57060 RepID=A0A8J6BLA8_ELECQ|nr:hypothetical protein GDO78_017630 [Eleutherodactylus coqui]